MQEPVELKKVVLRDKFLLDGINNYTQDALSCNDPRHSAAFALKLRLFDVGPYVLGQYIVNGEQRSFKVPSSAIRYMVPLDPEAYLQKRKVGRPKGT